MADRDLGAGLPEIELADLDNLTEQTFVLTQYAGMVLSLFRRCQV